MNKCIGSREVEIEYEYDKGQREIKNPPDMAQEGIPASASIHSITYFSERWNKKFDLRIRKLPKKIIEQLEEDCLQYHYESDGPDYNAMIDERDGY